MKTMQIFDFSKKSDQEKLYEIFLPYFSRRNIVPFFGSVFTRNYPAKRGLVPSVDELKSELIDIIAKVENYSEDNRDELREMKLSELAEIFWPLMEDEATPKEYLDQFYTYIEEHFCSVHDLPPEYQRLIGCRWRYIYTLNYDDAIEEASIDALNVIVPYCRQNQRWLAQKRCLYKLHGDSKKFLETGEKKYCILSTQQYLMAMSDKENAAMSKNLEADFSSNNIIFFGCSLLDELDILFAAGTHLAKEKRQNIDTHSYYVRYVGNDAVPLTVVQQQRFKSFAITDIIEVKAEDMLAFYSFLATISEEGGKLQKTDSLGEFTGFQFLQRESTDRENLEYLFYSSRIRPKDETNKFILPSFFVRRDITKQIIENVNSANGYFHIIRGGRLSGKSYVLVYLLKEFQSRNTYYFPSNKQISDQCFEQLLSLKNAILIFDEHCLSHNQIKWITSKYQKLISSNSNQIIMAIDRSTGMFTEHFLDRFPAMSEFVKIYLLPSEFNDGEAKCFNAEFGKLGLLDYECGWSLLDYMLKIDDESTKKHRSALPNINLIRDQKTLIAFILFANQESIPISQSNIMGITETLYALCKTANVAIQKDYLSEVEFAPDFHDGFRFVSNSKYWVYKCLSAYAKDHAHYNTIADAFYEIVSAIQRHYNGRFNQSYHQAVKPYYFFDTIQFIFFADSQQTGSLFLPDVIYKKLLPLFKDDFQFLHQKAKCLIWNSRRKKNNRERSHILNEALQQVARAKRLAQKRKPVNLEYTLYHMEVTKTLILVNNWRHCRMLFNKVEQSEQLSSLLKTFYDMEQQMLTWGKDLDLDEREIQDFNWFVAQLAESQIRRCMSPEDRKMAGNVMTKWREIQS